MPANQGEWVVGVVREVFDGLKFVGVLVGLLGGATLIFASN